MTDLLDPKILPADHCAVDTQRASVGGHPTGRGHRTTGTQPTPAASTISPPTTGGPTPEDVSSAGDISEHGQCCSATHMVIAVLDSCPPTSVLPTPNGQASAGTPLDAAPALRQPSAGEVQLASESQTRPDLSGWHELRIVSELFERAQLERIAVTNVVRTPAQGGNIDPGMFAPYVEHLSTTEHTAKLMLGRTYKRVVPAGIREWQATQHGIGQHLLARLLGIIGNPAVAVPHYWQGTGSNRVLMVEEARPRTIGQLWSYCGHGDPARKKRKGMTAEEAFALGSPAAKMIVHLLAEACMKQGSDKRYRQVYEQARVAAADKVHSVECVRCGPSGKPALPGSPWNPGHQHAHALRIVGKELLRDLWRAAA